jgi:glycine oxidase
MKIVIVGAGVAGLGIGWRLRQAGAEVVILERGQPAMGATWASAGMLAVTAETEGADPSEVNFAQYSNSLWPDFTAELEQESGQTIGFSRAGALMLSREPSTLAVLRARAESEVGLAILDADAARALVPLLRGEFTGALWAADEGRVDNRALGAALAAAFLRAGGTIITNEAVVRIGEEGGRAAFAETSYARHHGDAFLLAAGAWSHLVAEVPITPVKGEMIALAPPPGAMVPDPVVWGEGIYAVPRQGRLLIGATVEEAGFDTSLTEAARESLRAKAVAAMPGLAGWTVVDHWAGLRPRAPDGLPLLGPSRLPGLFVAGGQYRNGILFTPAIARLMADLILGRAEPVAAFDPRRFA